jgi:hypothetical protein
LLACFFFEIGFLSFKPSGLRQPTAGAKSSKKEPRQKKPKTKAGAEE